MNSRRDRLVLVALVTAVVFVVLVRQGPGGPPSHRAVDDLGQLLAATAAAVACLRQAGRAPGPSGRPWRLLAGGTGAWAVGELVWSWFELLGDRQTPFPSVADAGFLLFPVLAAAGLMRWPSQALRGGARWRGLLDGVLVAGALFILTWVTTLGRVVDGGSDSRFGFAVALAYPVADLVLLTLTVVVVAHARRVAGQTGLGLLAAGLSCLCLADSGFAYLTAAGAYVTGSIVDAGWFLGFLLVAVAAHTATAPPAERDNAPGLESTSRALLPYLPAGLGLAVALAGQLGGSPDRPALLAAAVVVTALLSRQLVAVLDNRRLVSALQHAQIELHHQAFHDPLTGLANRALFADRLRHGLALHERDMRPLSLLYCDLDGFKSINDSLGHDAGDEVLKAVAERLRAVTRSGDTVARMGGDEFAILLEDGGEATGAAARILGAFAQPANVAGQLVPLRTSIGIAELAPDTPALSAAALLHRADAAMYQSKRTGKGSATLWTPQLAALPDTGATAGHAPPRGSV